MKISAISIFVLTLLLGACKKEDNSPTGGLSGTAKKVNDILWGGTFANGTKSITIDDEVVYSETSGEAHSFTVYEATAYTSTQPGNTGQGIQYTDKTGKYQVQAIIPDDAPDIIAIVMVVDGNTTGLITHHF